jgi:hypothetical protein
MKSERSRRPQATRRQRGRAVTRRLPIKIASHRTLREAAIELGGPAIPLQSTRALPLCMSVRSPGSQQREKRRSPGTRPVSHCRLPRKHRWASAATPAQRNTTRPQEPPRRASDVINGTSMLGKGNPRWSSINVWETIKVPDVAPQKPRSLGRPAAGIRKSPATAVAHTLRNAGASVIAWLTSLPRRAGDRLFAMNDAEAGWRGWETTVLAGGLSRQYRDPHFSASRGGLSPGMGGAPETTPNGRAPAPPYPPAGHPYGLRSATAAERPERDVQHRVGRAEHPAAPTLA